MKTEKISKTKSKIYQKGLLFLLLSIFVFCKPANLLATEIQDVIASDEKRTINQMSYEMETSISENSLYEIECIEEVETLDAQQETTIIASGEGWTLDSDGHLNVNYSSSNPSYRQPWGTEYNKQIKSASLKLSEYVSVATLFYECENLETVDFQNSDLSKVTDASSLFYGCKNLKEVKGLFLPHVENAYAMFEDCQTLEKVDATSFASDQLKQVAFMFFGCYNLKEILNADLINLSKVESTAYMFRGACNLELLDVSGFNMSNVTNMDNMFNGCSSLKNLDMSKWNTQNVTNMSATFANCKNVCTFDFSNFDTSNVTDMEYMFALCGEGVLDLSVFQTPKVKNMRAMFIFSDLNEIILTNFDTHNVEDMTFMFLECSKLQKVDLSMFYTPRLKYCFEMFCACKSLNEINLSNFDFSNIVNSVEDTTELNDLIRGTGMLKYIYLPANVPQKISFMDSSGYWYDEAENNVKNCHVNLNKPMKYHAITMEEYYKIMEEEEDRKYREQLEEEQKEASVIVDPQKNVEDYNNIKPQEKKRQTIKLKSVKGSVITIKKSSFKKKSKRIYKLPIEFNGGKEHTVAKYTVVKYPKGAKGHLKVDVRGRVTFSKNAKKGRYQIEILLPESSDYKSEKKIITIRIK